MATDTLLTSAAVGAGALIVQQYGSGLLPTSFFSTVTVDVAWAVYNTTTDPPAGRPASGGPPPISGCVTWFSIASVLASVAPSAYGTYKTLQTLQGLLASPKSTVYVVQFLSLLYGLVGTFFAMYSFLAGGNSWLAAIGMELSVVGFGLWVYSVYYRSTYMTFTNSFWGPVDASGLALSVWGMAVSGADLIKSC